MHTEPFCRHSTHTTHRASFPAQSTTKSQHLPSRSTADFFRAHFPTLPAVKFVVFSKHKARTAKLQNFARGYVWERKRDHTSANQGTASSGGYFESHKRLSDLGRSFALQFRARFDLDLRVQLLCLVDAFLLVCIVSVYHNVTSHFTDSISSSFPNSNMAAGGTDNIRVAIRVRPFIKR